MREVDPATFFTASRLVIVAGKGGVGKTTVTAALALAAARAGCRTLIVEVEGKSGLAAMYDRPTFAYDEVVLADADEATGQAEVRARTLTPDEALVEFLERGGMSRISKRLLASGALDMVATAIPGIRDILVLGKIKQMERDGVADLILLDAPAAGHAITFLQSASGLADAVPFGPINAQATDVLEMLGDPERCQVLLVTLPEETPVNEVVETAYALEDRVGISLGPVVVNGTYPPLPGLDADPVAAAEAAGASLRDGEAEALAAAAAFRRERTELQVEQVERLSAALPLPQLTLPYLFDDELGPAQLGDLADAVLAGIEALP